MIYLTLIAGIIAIILSLTGFWTVPVWVGIAMIATPLVIVLFGFIFVVLIAWVAEKNSSLAWTR